MIENDFSISDNYPKYDYIDGCFEHNQQSVELKCEFKEGSRTYLIVIEIDWIGSIPEKTMTLEGRGPQTVDFVFNWQAKYDILKECLPSIMKKYETKVKHFIFLEDKNQT